MMSTMSWLERASEEAFRAEVKFLASEEELEATLGPCSCCCCCCSLAWSSRSVGS